MKSTIVQGAIALRDAHFVAMVAENTLRSINIESYIDILSDDSVAVYMSSDMGKNYDVVVIIYNDSRPISWGITTDNNPDLDSILWWGRYAELVAAINQTRFSFINEGDRVDMNYFGPEDIKSFL
jgi:hypothetical protein